MPESKAMTDIIAERERQDAKWGQQNHGPNWWLVIALEEFGEAARAVLEGNGADYREEMIHLAAVAVAAVESADRGNLELQDVTALQKEIAAKDAEIKKLEGWLEQISGHCGVAPDAP